MSDPWRYISRSYLRNLDNTDPEDVLALLSEEQRVAFLKLAANPDDEAVNDLLAFDERTEPWWERPPEVVSTTKKYGHPPEVMDLSDDLRRGPPPASKSMLFNIFAIS